MKKNNPSICLVTCYRDPNYVRVKTLEAGLRSNDNFKLSFVRNNNRGPIRYFEVIYKLLIERFTNNPDIYIVTFRGYEILPFVLLIGLGKKVVFDEFINLVEWAVYEHKKIDEKSFFAKLLHNYYFFLLSHCTAVLTDTDSHADYSSDLMNIDRTKYFSIPVGVDEHVFQNNLPKNTQKSFQVFYYGSMLALHGIEHVIEAARLLSRDKSIQFLIVGGNQALEDTISEAQKNGSQITYKKWIPYDKLPVAIAESNVCLGGPFGDTIQSQFVITGKTYQFLRLGALTIIGKNKETNIFSDHKNTLLITQANPQQLVDSILWAKDNQQQANEIAQNGQRFYTEHFSSLVIAKKLDQLILNL